MSCCEVCYVISLQCPPGAFDKDFVSFLELDRFLLGEKGEKKKQRPALFGFTYILNNMFTFTKMI